MVPLLLTVAIMAAVAAALGAGTAAAAPAPDDAANPPAATVVRAEMLLDCTNMRESVHEYAVAHEYCPPAGSGDVSTNGIVYGNCGSSEIWLSNEPGVGWASVVYGFNSSVGTVVHRNLGIGVAGDDASPSWNDSGWMNSSTYYAGNSVWTGIGWAYASLGGTVTLIWGGQCTLLEPQAAKYIN